MILAGMHLLNYSTDARTILPHKNKKILYNKPVFSVLVNKLHMSQPLLVCTNFISTFDNENTIVF